MYEFIAACLKSLHYNASCMFTWTSLEKALEDACLYSLAERCALASDYDRLLKVMYIRTHGEYASLPDIQDLLMIKAEIFILETLQAIEKDLCKELSKLDYCPF